MSSLRKLFLSAAGSMLLAPLCALASPVTAVTAFGHEPMGYWSTRVAGIKVRANPKPTSVATGYYYGNSLRPLTVWVSDLAKAQSAGQASTSATNSWRTRNPEYVNPHRGRGHEGWHFREEFDGERGHEIGEDGIQNSPVPLPTSWILLLTGVAALFGLRRSPLVTEG